MRGKGTRWAALAAACALGGCGGMDDVGSLFGDGTPGAGTGARPMVKGPVVTGTADGTETVTFGNGFGLYLPKNVAGFTREDTSLGHGAPGAVAGYAHLDDPGPVMATIHARRSGADASPFAGSGPDANAQRSDAALDASIAEARRFYPDLQVGPRSDVFLVRFGAVQHGRSATVRFTDLLAGERQAVAMRIETYCCLGGRWDYEYRFRAPAAVDAALLEHEFANGTAWSRDPSGSIDQPE